MNILAQQLCHVLVLLKKAPARIAVELMDNHIDMISHGMLLRYRVTHAVQNLLIILHIGRTILWCNQIGGALLAQVVLLQ